MELYVHKYKPKKYDDFLFHTDYLDSFHTFHTQSELLNIIIYGDYGSGKLCLSEYLINLYNHFDNQVYNTKVMDYEIEDNGIYILKSACHYMLDVCDSKYNDKKIISDFIGEISKTINICNNNYKTILIKNADHFSIQAQNTIINLLENYFVNCRIIFICNNITKLSDNLISRCLLLHINSPSKQDINNVLENIIQKEKIKIDEKKLEHIIELSDFNINDAIFLLEHYHWMGYIQINPIQNLISNFIQNIFIPMDIIDIKKNIYELMIYDISFDEFSTHLIKYLGEIELNFKKRFKIIEAISYYSYLILKGYRAIFHFECLIIFIIQTLKDIDTKLIQEVI